MQAAVNYPIVGIFNSSVALYARTFNRSTTSIAVNAPVTTSFTVPNNAPVGSVTLFVGAAGLFSTGVPVTITAGPVAAGGVADPAGASCANPLAATHDFNGDGKSDILWRNTSGTVAAWLMNGGAVAQSAALATLPANFSVVGQHDFNGDGKADILWRDRSCRASSTSCSAPIICCSSSA